VRCRSSRPELVRRLHVVCGCHTSNLNVEHFHHINVRPYLSSTTLHPGTISFKHTHCLSSAWRLSSLHARHAPTQATSVP